MRIPSLFPMRLAAVVLAAGSLLAACGGGDSDDWSEPSPPPLISVNQVDGRYMQAKAAPSEKSSALVERSASALALVDAANITLPALNVSAILLKNLGAPGPLQMAQAQPVLQADTAQKLAALLQWQRTAQGHWLATLRVNATDAYGIRLGLLVEALPETAVLRVFQNDTSSIAYETSGEAIAALLEMNAEAGDDSDAARTWWSPDLGGDSVVLEIELPADSSPAQVQLALPTISNVFTSPDDYAYAAEEELSALALGTSKNEAIPSAEACNLDVTCFVDGLTQRDAVARMVFVVDGNGFYCTGTLLNDAIESDNPYFLTANHCIGNQTVASTLQTDWFFRSATCGTQTLNPRATKLLGGARLLYTSTAAQAHDTSLLVLNDAAPAGAYLAGWDANLRNERNFIYGIHHPAGSLAKISGGETLNYANCDGSGRCGTNANSSGRYYQVQWSEGTTEGGSSGSAIFLNGRVIGVLHAGSASCSLTSGSDYYGRFDMGFQNGMRDYLTASRNPL